MTQGRAEPAIDLILWDVQDEHLAEAEFYFSQWNAALDSGSWTLPELALGTEKRFLAHVDGIVIGGAPVVERVLQPLLSEPDGNSFERLVTACVALCQSGRLDLVTGALESEHAVLSGAAEHALVLTGPDGLDSWLESHLARTNATEVRSTLLRISAQRHLRRQSLLAELQSENPAKVAAAARAAEHADANLHLAALEELLSHADHEVRNAALRSALVHGSGYTLQVCLQRARQTATCDAFAMLAVALFCQPGDHQALVEHLQLETHREAAIFALGYSGQVAMIPRLLEVVADGDERARKLAGEAISTLGGIEIEEAEATTDEQSLVPLEEDDLDVDLVSDAVDGLPLPNLQALQTWCQTRQGELDLKHRVIAGERWDLSLACAFLERAPMRRRPPVSLWLAVTSRGRAQVDPRALTVTQAKQITVCRNLDLRSLRALSR